MCVARGNVREPMNNGGSDTNQKKRIIVVDDEQNMRHAVFRVLRDRPYEVVLAQNGEVGVEMAQKIPPDLIILDLMMPGLDGYGVVQRLHESGLGAIPIVIITGKTTTREIMDGYRKGATYYITKPFKAEELTNVVDYLVGDLSEEEREVLEAQL